MKSLENFKEDIDSIQKISIPLFVIFLVYSLVAVFIFIIYSYEN